jgi:pimeloyl-ACP methyl ester carboxylesterase
MATYVMVGGAWLGGWAWKDVAEGLRARGHTAYPATLTGLGERVHLATPDVDLDTHITDVANLMHYEDLTDVVLVGHSYSGIVVEGAADRASDRVGVVVYVDTAPMGDGVALLDVYPQELREQTHATVAASGEGWRLPFPGFEQLAAQASLAGLGAEQRRLMTSRAAAQPFATYTQPLRLTGAGKTYERRAVICSDGGFTVEQIRQALASGDPGLFAAYAGPGWEFDEIHTGHWPMLSAPGELARVLDRYGALTA